MVWITVHGNQLGLVVTMKPVSRFLRLTKMFAVSLRLKNIQIGFVITNLKSPISKL